MQLCENALIVVLGPTASGKTALAVELARTLGGEVISADSMQIYRGMDIGTAKPTEEERAGIPHHLIDIKDPGERFSVAEYSALAKAAVAEVQSRGRVPILAGGTGLYIQSVVDNIHYDEEAVHDDALREEMRRLAAEKGNGAVWELLQQLDPESAASLHPNNLGRVIRAVEVVKMSGRTIGEQVSRSRMEASPYRTCQIGLKYNDRNTLYDRIDRRVDSMLEQGLVEETKKLFAAGFAGTAGQAIGYKELAGYLNGECSLQQAAEKLKQGSRRYAKRQLTWFGRDDRIHWILPDALPEGKTVLLAALEQIEKECGVAK